MSASTCPRCQTALTACAPPVGRDEAPLEIDRCERCGGLWLDGPEVAAVAPVLAALRGRKKRRNQAGGITRCPCCGGETEECSAYGVQVDLCSSCHGVWLDGGELEALRERAVSAGGRNESVPCQACGAAVNRRRAAVTGSDLRCAPCEQAFRAVAEQPQQLERPSSGGSGEAAAGFFAGLEFLGAFVELVASIAQAFA